MKSFKEFVANDNRHPASDSHDVKRKFMELHNKKRDPWEEKQYQALKDHPDVKGFKVEEQILRRARKNDSIPGDPAKQMDMSVRSDASSDPGSGQVVSGGMTVKSDKSSEPGSGQVVSGGMTIQDKKKKDKNSLPLAPMTPRT